MLRRQYAPGEQMAATHEQSQGRDLRDAIAAKAA
jgi:hypothetical protein